jgi:anti-anti-sigma regulatory factor
MQAEAVEDAVVLRLEGVLTSAAAPQLRLAIQEQFASHALPLVCDLPGLRRIEPAVIGVFHSASAACGGWPIVSLSLARPRPAVASHLRKSGAGKFLVVTDTLAQAVDAALAGPRLLRDSVELRRRTAVVDGRRFAADCCLRWLVPELLEPTTERVLDLLQHATSVTKDGLSLQMTCDHKSMLLRARVPRPDLAVVRSVELPGARLESDGSLLLQAGVADPRSES